MGALCPRAFSSFTTLLFLLAERTDFIQFSRLASKISRQNRALIDNILLLLIQYFIFSFMSNLLPPASRSSHRLLRLLLLWLSIGLGFPLLAKPSNGSPAAGGPTAQPLQQALNADGTLRSGATGSFDPRGYRMVKDQATGKPAFRPTGTGDEKWQDGFGFPGTDGEVSAVVRLSSGNLIVGGSFTAAGSTLINYIARWDGTSWSSLGAGVNGPVLALALDGSGNVYAGGAFTQAGGAAASNIAKWNGTSWSSLGSGASSTVRALAVDGSGNVYAGGDFTNAGGSIVNRIAKWNGSSWSSLGTGTANGIAGGSVYALVVDGANVYAGGTFTQAGGATATRLAKWNGASWSSLGIGTANGVNNTVRALAADGAGNVYAGGDFLQAGGITANRLARWNGSGWSSLATNFDSRVCALTLDGSGNMYVGGEFTYAGATVSSANIAKWNGSSWSGLGTGMNGAVNAIVVDGSGVVHAGGVFNKAGVAGPNNIARWNGTGWNSLGSGVSATVRALAVDGSGNIYAGGDFIQAGGAAVGYIAKWNGTNWSSLGSGVSSTVYALAVDASGNVYVGGGFTQAGGLSANNIAKWNGTSWSSLGSGTTNGVSATVRALAVDGSGNVYAGGDFTAAGGAAASYIAKWNGSSWSSLGTGFNGSVNALAVDGSGNVYTGGAFTQAGGTAASNIAKWNGTSWSSLGSGVNSTVYAIAIEGSNNVYVGGNFSSAGAAQASFVAKWDGTSWSGMGSRVSNTTYALAVDASGSVYVGSSALVGIPASDAFIAKWDGTSWSALGTGLSFPVYALAMRGSSVAVGGSFTKVGDNSKVVARFGIYNTAQAPTVSALSPNSGPVGMPISITGTNLTGATTITFTGTSGNTVTSGFTVNAAGTQITGVVVPAGAQTGNVTVTTPGGTSNGVLFTVNAPQLAVTQSGTAYASGGTAYNFGNQAVSTSSTPVAFTLSNAGTAALAISSISTTGNFATSGTVPTSVAAGGSATVNVVFTPTATGTRTGTLLINSSLGTYTVNLTGNGTTATTPTITSLNPNSGPVGTVITINGTNLTGASPIVFPGPNGVVTTGYTVNAAGTQITGVVVPNGAITGNVMVVTPNGTSNGLLFTVTTGTGTYFEDMETGTKAGTGYATGVATLASGAWTFTDALLGNAAGQDKFSGTRSARIRGGSIAMNFDRPGGAGTVSFKAALFNTDTGVSVKVEASNNGGQSYTDITGSPAPVLTAALQTFTFTANLTGPVRLRISNTNQVAGSGSRINVDDIDITNYNATAPPTLTSVNPTSGSIGAPVTLNGTNLTGTTAITFTGTSGNTVTSGFTVNAAGTQITGIVVPSGASTGNLTVTTPGGVSNGVLFTVNAPQLVVRQGSTTYPSDDVAYSFGTQTLNTSSAAVTFTLSNPGSSPLAISSITTTGDYATSGTLPSSVAAGSSATVNVVFTPTVIGTCTGTLVINSSAGTYTVNLTGTGTTPPPTLTSLNPTSGPVGTALTITGTYLSPATRVAFNGFSTTAITSNNGTQLVLNVPSGATTGNVTVTTPAGTSNGLLFTVTAPQIAVSQSGTSYPNNGTAYNFGNQTVNTSSGPHAFTVTNPGTAPLVISGWATTGDFATTTGTATIPAGSSGTISVLFAPTVAGTRTGTLVISSNAGAYTVNLTGNGLAPAPTLTSINPASGPVGLGVSLTGTNLTGTTTITFTGTSGNTVTSGFTVNAAGTQITGIVVPGGASTGNVTVTTPGGTSNGVLFTVTIPQLLVRQNGTSYPNNGTAYNFGNQPLTTSSSAVAFTLSNPGTAALAISSITTTGDYATSGTLPSSIAAGGSTTVGVMFSPTVIGTCTGTLVINSSAGTYTVNLTGTGVTAPPTITSFSPTTGYAGNSVTITGTNFTSSAIVRFNGTSAPNMVVNSATSISAVVPVGASTGTITVMTPSGTATSSSVFTVLGPPPATVLISPPTVPAFCAGGSQTLTASVAMPSLFNTANAGFASTLPFGGVWQVAVQPDGKIVAGGNFTSFNGDAAVPDHLARLNADGTLDNTFNAGGTGFDAQVTSSYISPVYTVALVNGGQIIVGGKFTQYNGNAAAADCLVRLNPNGSLDNTFNAGGSGFNGPVLSVAVQPDGKILVAGEFTQYNGSSVPSKLVRLNSNGTLDNSFSAGGFNGLVTKVLVQPDGRVLVGGSFTRQTPRPGGFLRLYPSGTLDTTFNGGGAGFVNGVDAFDLQTDGRIVVGTRSNDYNGSPVARVLRLNPDGSVDGSFNIGVGTNMGAPSTLICQSDGHVLVGGNLYVPSTPVPAQRRFIQLNSDGSLNMSFNNGTATANGGEGPDGQINTIALLPDDKILIGGMYFTSYNRNTSASDFLTRLNADGTLDTSPVPAGVVFTWSTGATGNSITVSSSGNYGATAVVDGNTVSSNTVSVTVIPQVALTALNPANGNPGNNIIITGSGFSSMGTFPPSGVSFNGTAANYTVNSDTQITAVVPSGTNLTGPVTVTNTCNTSNGLTFTLNTPQLAVSQAGTPYPSNGMAYDFGPRAVGSTSPAVTFTLSNTGTAGLFLSGFSTTGNFAITGSQPTTIAAGGTATISLVFSPGAVGIQTGTLSIGSDLGTYTVNLTGTGTTPLPTLTTLNPTSGPVGTNVTISGTNLTGATSVLFNGTAASNFSVLNATTIGAVVPAGATTGNVTVVTPGGTSNGLLFTVTLPPAQLEVSQNGTSYPSGGAAYSFGNQLIGTSSTPVDFTLSNTGGITLIINSITTTGNYAINGGLPSSITAGGNAQVNVVFTPTAAGTRTGTLVISTNVGTYTVNLTGNGTTPTPTISSLNPSSGPVGTTVVITGTNLTGASSVKFNGTAATSFTVNSATQITATVPAGATTGPVSVTTSVGTGSSPGNFTVVPFTVINQGPPANSVLAARNTPVGVGFSAPVNGSTAGNIRVFSAQYRGRRSTTVSSSGSAATLTPTVPTTGSQLADFKAGETVLVTVPGTVLSTGGAAAKPYVYQFTTATTGSSANFLPGTDPAVGVNPYDMAIGDVNGDGNVDLLAANGGSNTVSIRLGNGTGTFSGSVNVPVGVLPEHVVLGDVDADGDLDFVVAIPNSNLVNVRLNNGSGTFSNGTDAAVGTNPYQVFLADANGDGSLDLFAANVNANTVSVRLNNGLGVFNAGSQDVAVGSTPRSLAIGDVDNDGDVDIATANSTSPGSVSVRLNNGLAVFGGGGDYAVGNRPYGIALGDVNGDGYLDALTGNQSAGTVSVRLNNGSGAFGGGQDVAVGSAAEKLALGDVDGDGDLDFVVALDMAAGAVAVRLNNGAGSFTGSTSVSVGARPFAAALADVDGDGDLDLLAPNYDSGTVSVRLNTQLTPTVASLSPTSGPVGTSVTITGTNLLGASSVRFNGLSASAFTVVSATTITATVPVGASTGNVTVTTPGGTSNGVLFTVTAAQLAVTQNGTSYPSNGVAYSFGSRVVSTSSAPVAFTLSNAGTTPLAISITTTGDYATSGTLPTSIAAGGAATVSVVFTPTTTGTRTGTLVINSSLGTYTVNLTGNGTTTLPVINALIASRGPIGTVITIMGNNLAGASSVSFNGFSTTAISSNNGGQLVVTVPAGATTGPVRVTTPLGVSNPLGFTVTGTPAFCGTSVAGPGGPLMFTNVFQSQPAAANTRAYWSFTGVQGNSYAFSTCGTTQDTYLRIYDAAGMLMTGKDDNGPYCSGAAASLNFAPPMTGTYYVHLARASCNLLTAPVNLLYKATAVPALSSLSPASGPVGTVVTINGTNLSGATSVRFNSLVTTTILSNNGSQLVVAVPSGATTGNVSVTTPSGVSNPLLFTVTGPTAGLCGTSVPGAGGPLNFTTTFQGRTAAAGNRYYWPFTATAGSTYAFSTCGSTEDTYLRVYDANGVEVDRKDDGGPYCTGLAASLNFTPSSSGSYVVHLAHYSCQPLSAPVTLFYKADGPANTPTLTGISPGNGPVGTVLTLKGYNLLGASLITFAGSGGNTVGSGFTVNASGTEITGVVVPTGAQTGAVTVTTPNGITNGLTFTVGVPPSIGAFSPGFGGTGSTVTITGSSFSRPAGAAGATGLARTAATVATVEFNGVPTTFTVVSPTELSAVVPAGATTGPISVKSDDGKGISASNFELDLTVSTTATVPGGIYHDLIITGSGDATLGGDVRITGSLLVQPGGKLSDGCHVVRGAGSFQLSAGATLALCDSTGISAADTTGTIKVSGSRSYSPGASYVYQGHTDQATGDGLPAQVRSLTVDNPAPVTLSQPVAVQQELRLLGAGKFSLNDQPLTLLSDASGTALVVNGGSGVAMGATATMQRYLNTTNLGAGYRHYSSPVSGNSLADLATATFTPRFNAAFNTSATPNLVTPFPTVLGYDQARLAGPASTYSGFDKGWYSPSSGASSTPDQFETGRGYSVNIAGSEKVDFTGELNTGTYALPLLRNTGATAADAGWQLVGNPYPAPIDWSLVTAADRPGLDASMYVYESSSQYGGQYRSYVNGVGSASSLIGAGQGFFVRVSQGLSSGTLTFRDQQRIVSYSQQVPVRRGGIDVRPQLQLTIQGAGSQDELFVYAEPGATAGLDAGFDAAKLPNPTGLNLAALAATGQELAIQGLPTLSTATQVPLRVQVPVAGTYSVRAVQLQNLPAGLRAYLLDKQTGARYDLTQGASYAISLSLPLSGNRFELVFAPQQVLGTAAASLSEQVLLYPNPARRQAWLQLPAQLGRQGQAVQVLDVLGRAVRSLNLPAQGSTPHLLPLTELPAGVYTLRMLTEQGSVAKRLVLE